MQFCLSKLLVVQKQKVIGRNRLCSVLLTFATLIPKETRCKKTVCSWCESGAGVETLQLLRQVHSVVDWKQGCWRLWCQTIVALRDSTLLCRLLPSWPFFIYEGPPLLFQCSCTEKKIFRRRWGFPLKATYVEFQVFWSDCQILSLILNFFPSVFCETPWNPFFGPAFRIVACRQIIASPLDPHCPEICLCAQAPRPPNVMFL